MRLLTINDYNSFWDDAIHIFQKRAASPIAIGLKCLRIGVSPFVGIIWTFLKTHENVNSLPRPTPEDHQKVRWGDRPPPDA